MHPLPGETLFPMVSNWQLSSTPGDQEGIDVWFSLLGSLEPSGENLVFLKSSEKQLPLSMAYRHLAKATAMQDVPLRLKVSKDTEVVSD